MYVWLDLMEERKGEKEDVIKVNEEA